MTVGFEFGRAVLPVAGISLASAESGIRYADRPDTVLLCLREGTNTVAVFTRNAFCAAPVIVAKEHLLLDQPRYLLINSGNANAGTGPLGLEMAKESCEIVASAANVATATVLPFSTGVIGEQLAVEKFRPVMPQLLASLDEANWEQAAAGIMTTDTVSKSYSTQVELAQGVVTITGMSKGSGMICPNMATMLAYVGTDAAVEKPLLRFCLDESVAVSFNSITVDGDTSTNDACVLMATGASGVAVESAEDIERFSLALAEVMTWLAQAIIRDAEGITKFITLHVEGATSLEEAKTVAYTVAHSPLVKTAFFASDANWGRILAAVGRAPVEGLDVSLINISLGDVAIVKSGAPAEGYKEEKGAEVMAKEEIGVTISLGRGDACATVWTSDLSYAYVKINADYRS